MSGKKAYIKCRGSDPFIIGRNSTRNLQILAKVEHIVEVNNCFFVYNNVTGLWTVTNSDYSYINIPDIVKNDRIWMLFEYKERFIFSGKKMKPRQPRNTFTISDDQVENVIKEAAINNYSYKELYQSQTEKYNLPEYRLPDK